MALDDLVAALLPEYTKERAALEQQVAAHDAEVTRLRGEISARQSSQAAVAGAPARQQVTYTISGASIEQVMRDLARLIEQERASYNRVIDAKDSEIELLCNALMPSLPKRQGFQVDPAFKASQLTGEARTWYDNLMNCLKQPEKLYPNPLARKEDPYSVGRTTKSHVLALMMALDKTGDRTFLTAIVDIMSKLNLKGLETQEDLAETLQYSFFSLYAYLLSVNKDQYGKEAIQWRDALVARLGERQYVRSKSLAHTQIARLLSLECLYRTTGDEKWENEAKTLIKLFQDTYVEEHPDGRLTWWHDNRDASRLTWGKQNTDYARYVIGDLAVLSVMGVNVLPMEKVAKAVDHIIRADKTVAGTIAGDGDWNNGFRALAISNYALIGKWDAKLRERFGTIWKEDMQPTIKIHIPAAMLWTA